jgi:hypothetical protein
MGKRRQQKKPVYRVVDLRATEEELDEITRAAQAEAAELRIVYSRNNYCVRMLLAAARKQLKKDGTE